LSEREKIECKTLTAREVARLLGVDRNLVYESVARGEVPGAIRLGRRIVFVRSVVLRWLGQDSAPSEE
jgi:excisionase family DNA binding protein